MAWHAEWEVLDHWYNLEERRSVQPRLIAIPIGLGVHNLGLMLSSSEQHQEYAVSHYWDQCIKGTGKWQRCILKSDMAWSCLKPPGKTKTQWCICARIFSCVCVRAYVCTSARDSVRAYECMCIFMFIFVCACACLFACENVLCKQ